MWTCGGVVAESQWSKGGVIATHSYLCNLRPKASVVCPKASDAHHKPSDAHPKASDDKLKVIEIVATKPKTVNAKEYSRKPFTLHFWDLIITLSIGLGGEGLF